MNAKNLLATITILFAMTALAGCFGSLEDPANNPQINSAVEPLGIDECYNCHDSLGLASNDPVFWEWSASRHGNADNNPAGVLAAECLPCHDRDADSLNLAGFIGPGSVPAPRSVVGCEACHIGVNPSPHSGANLQQPVANIPDPATCMGCHELVDQAGTPMISSHSGTADWLIGDSHLAAAGSYPGGSNRGVNMNPVAGYVMDYSDTKVCRNCHSIHTFDKTRNLEWAQSAHADTSAAGAWAHYNWTEDGAGTRNDGSATSSRGACQMCHTTSGAIAFMTASEKGTGYNPPLSFDPDFAPEMLLCSGCHTDSRGYLRKPGPITVHYDDVPPFTFPDLAGSNICMTCHTGRESGGSIKNSTDDFSNKSFVNSHYLTAGATVFSVSGYEYDVDGNPGTDDYANVFFVHDQIGINDPLSTGIEGPCVGCHLSSTQSHLFMPVTHDGSGHITAITSTVCSECHSGSFSINAGILDSLKTGYHDALAALEGALSIRGYTFLGRHPYFSAKDWTAAGDPSGKHDMGAAFNYNLLEHDPGAYVHNRIYVKRLIFDSIDWVDNSNLDGVIDLTGHSSAAGYLNASDPVNAVTRP